MGAGKAQKIGRSNVAGGLRQDMRVVKTRIAIRRAFLALIAQNDYNDITITAIADEAMISRKSFYKHYPSIGALLEDVAADQIRLVVEEIQAPDEVLEVPEAITQFTAAAMRVLRDNPGLDSNLMRSISTSAFLEMVKVPLSEAFRRELEKRGIAELPQLNYWIAYYLGGLCSVYVAWKSAGASDADLDRIAQIVGLAAGGVLDKVLSEGGVPSER